MPKRVRNSSITSRSGALSRPYAISVTLIQAIVLPRLWVLPRLLSVAANLARNRRRVTRPGRLPQVQLLEEVVALVVDHDEGGKILHLDAPDRLHPEFGIFHRLDLLDAVLSEICRGAADRGEIEA